MLLFLSLERSWSCPWCWKQQRTHPELSACVDQTWKFHPVPATLTLIFDYDFYFYLFNYLFFYLQFFLWFKIQEPVNSTSCIACPTRPQGRIIDGQSLRGPTFKMSNALTLHVSLDRMNHRHRQTLDQWSLSVCLITGLSGTGPGRSRDAVYNQHHPVEYSEFFLNLKYIFTVYYFCRKGFLSLRTCLFSAQMFTLLLTDKLNY